MLEGDSSQSTRTLLVRDDWLPNFAKNFITLIKNLIRMPKLYLSNLQYNLVTSLSDQGIFAAPPPKLSIRSPPPVFFLD